MKKYTVSCKDFYNAMKISDSFKQDLFRTTNSIGQLIHRYNITGKTVLSVGGGSGYEEYHFLNSNCKLTFCDIDQHGSIEPVLQKCHAPDDENDALVYFIGDAKDICNLINLGKTFDVCYFSSFTPDEQRRLNIQQKCRLWNFPYHVWPKKTQPFSELLIKILDAVLAKHGIFICQSYHGGVDVSDHFSFNYIDMMKEQLEKIGVVLSDQYYWVQVPAVTLTIGFRADKSIVKGMFCPNEISNFHGRGCIERGDEPDISKSYDLRIREVPLISPVALSRYPLALIELTASRIKHHSRRREI